MSIDRLVTTPSGLNPKEMIEVMMDPALGARGLEVMANFMAPEGSMYFDAIYGASYGQKNIRGGLIPVMTENALLEFEPTREGELLDDGRGGTSIDEWRMTINKGESVVAVALGVSVRTYRDGWIQTAEDVYDTMSLRSAAPLPAGVEDPAGATEAPPLPPYPTMNFKPVEVDAPEPLSEAAQAWIEARRVAHATGESGTTEPSGLSNDDLHVLHAKLVYDMNFDFVADLMHPTDAEYLDPIYGEFKGQANIRAWLTDVMGKVGDIIFEPLMQPVWNGSTSLQKWRQVAELSDGTMVQMAWGYSVHRFKDGWLVYTADYVDTAGLARPEVESVSEQIGAEISHEDMMREGKPSSPE